MRQVWSSQEDDKVVPDYICMWNAGGKAEGEDQLEISCDGKNVVLHVWKVLDKIKDFTDHVQNGTWIYFFWTTHQGSLTILAIRSDVFEERGFDDL
ncbi:unnamed protein product [Sphagnum tenellum]